MPARPPRVLIVEDDPREAEALARLLAGHGAVVAVAPTVREARRLRDGADVVLLDLGLPDGDGLELLPALRPRPVLVITGRAGVRPLVRAFERGAADYVLKPYDPRELLARLGRVLRAAAALRAAARRRGEDFPAVLHAGPALVGPVGGPRWAAWALIGPGPETARRLARLAPPALLIVSDPFRERLPPEDRDLFRPLPAPPLPGLPPWYGRPA